MNEMIEHVNEEGDSKFISKPKEEEKIFVSGPGEHKKQKTPEKPLTRKELKA
jgi:hypothetical protein